MTVAVSTGPWTIRALDVASMVAVGVMLALAWTRRDRIEGRLLVPMLVGVEVWVLGDLIAQSPVPVAVLRGAVTLQLVTSGAVVLCLLLFVLAYTGRSDAIGPPLVALLLVEPVGFTVLALTNPAHRLVFRTPLAPDAVVASAGPALLVHVGYSYALVAVALAAALALVYRSRFVYRRQTAAVVLGVLPPFAGNVLYFFGPVSIDLTPVAFVLTGALLTYATVRAELLDLSPIAWSVVRDSIGNGILVLDRDGAVLDSNPQASRLLGADRPVVGQPVTDLLADPGPLERFVASGVPETDVTVEFEVGERVLVAETTPLPDVRGRTIGAALVLYDVTERRRQRRELERQRERLDQFASVVSHDLRNPLNVAAGRVDLAREECDADHLDVVVEAHDRMESILQETLLLARQGRSIGTTTWLQLPALCRDCWEMVESDDATLVVDEDLVIRGDETRLRHLFENLFRNAVEHSSTGSLPTADDAVEHGSTGSRTASDAPDDGSAVRVEVGALPGGFYVEDDGPGIPPEVRDEVFELGHSITNGGTGLGLAIVDEIVAAHEWTIEITDAPGGGARFEITGVECAD
ncbi:MAG: histidine kinase N-terminal 7TM domain-containing protein [Haloarculaceae archaeon]